MDWILRQCLIEELQEKNCEKHNDACDSSTVGSPRVLRNPHTFMPKFWLIHPTRMDQTIYSIKLRFPQIYGDQKCENSIPVHKQKPITSALMQSQVKVVVGQKKQVNWSWGWLWFIFSIHNSHEMISHIECRYPFQFNFEA